MLMTGLPRAVQEGRAHVQRDATYEAALTRREGTYLFRFNIHNVNINVIFLRKIHPYCAAAFAFSFLFPSNMKIWKYENMDASTHHWFSSSSSSAGMELFPDSLMLCLRRDRYSRIRTLANELENSKTATGRLRERGGEWTTRDNGTLTLLTLRRIFYICLLLSIYRGWEPRSEHVFCNIES